MTAEELKEAIERMKFEEDGFESGFLNDMVRLLEDGDDLTHSQVVSVERVLSEWDPVTRTILGL